MKTYTTDEIITVIDTMIKEEMARKNAYVEKNGYSHRDKINRFAERIAAWSELYGRFT